MIQRDMPPGFNGKIIHLVCTGGVGGGKHSRVALWTVFDRRSPGTLATGLIVIQVLDHPITTGPRAWRERGKMGRTYEDYGRRVTYELHCPGCPSRVNHRFTDATLAKRLDDHYARREEETGKPVPQRSTHRIDVSDWP